MTYLEKVKEAVEKSHGCTATHTGTVPVREVFRGSVVWEGEVEVFTISGHPKATRCYAWGYAIEGGRTESVTVLEIPPVTSPQIAVKVAIAAQRQG
jgi:hypothetical protein